MSKLIYRHISDGEFIAEMEDGSFKDLGPNAVGMIRYVYFEGETTYPPDGWEVTSKQLMEDYQPKMMRDYQEGNFELSHIDKNGTKHYKHKDD